MTRQRDTQRKRLYAAEAIYLGTTKQLDDIFEVQKLVTKVWKSKRVQAAFPAMMPNSVPYVGDGRGRRNAGGDRRGIYMPIWSRSEGIVLHELAHTMAERVFGSSYEHKSWHGWEFCSVYLKLVLYIHGRDSHDLLKKGMKLHRVRFTAPRKRKPLDPETRAALIARLSVYNGTAATEAAA